MEDNKTQITEEQLLELNKELEAQNADNPIIARAKEIGTADAPAESVEDMDQDIENAFQEGTGIDLYQASMDTMAVDEKFRDEIIEEVSSKFGISVADVLSVMEVSKRHKAGEKFSIFNALPDKVKGFITTNISATGGIVDNRSKALFSELFIDEFNSEFVDKYLDRGMVEFNKSIQETLGSITNVVDMYAGHIRYMMEVELRKKAEATDNEAAKLIYNSCADAFTKSYTYSKMLSTIETNSKARRKLYKDNFKFSKFCRDFDYRNKDTKFSIRNVQQLTDNLIIHLGEELDISKDDAMAFTILFIRSCDDINLKQLPNAMYAYYTIFNIVNLGFDTNKSSFYHTIVNNIKKVFNAMWKQTGNDRRFEIDTTLDTDDWWKDEDLSTEALAEYTDSINFDEDTKEDYDETRKN